MFGSCFFRGCSIASRFNCEFRFNLEPTTPNPEPAHVALPLRYNFRNVLVRWRSTLATILGVALVVAVYVLLQSLAIGLEKSSGNTGDPRNVMVVRKNFKVLALMDEYTRYDVDQAIGRETPGKVVKGLVRGWVSTFGATCALKTWQGLTPAPE